MSQESDNLLKIKIEELKSRIIELGDPKQIALSCGMEYSENLGISTLSFSILNIPVEINYPEFIVRNASDGRILNTIYQALISYYWLTTSISPCKNKLEKQWISFADLPEGKFYNKAFQGYTGDKLRAPIESDINKFSQIALQLNSTLLDLGDISCQFLFLPKVPVAVVYWRGEDEFPSNCKILFDRSVSNHLPTDACAMAGSMLSKSIINLMNGS